MGVDAWALAIAILSAIIGLGSAIGSIWYARHSTHAAIDQSADAKRSADSASVQADTALRQLELSEQVRREQQEPHVVVDIRPSEQILYVFMFIIENIGTTVARDVQISCDPPLARTLDDRHERPFREALIFREGIPTLPPGRRIEFLFDTAMERLTPGSTLPTEYTFTVDAEGPFGPIAQATYKVDLAIYGDVEHLGVQSVHDGVKTLDRVRKAVETIAKNTGRNQRPPRLMQ